MSHLARAGRRVVTHAPWRRRVVTPSLLRLAGDETGCFQQERITTRLLPVHSALRCFSEKPLSPRKQAQLEEQVLSAANVADPCLGTPIRTLGWLKKVTTTKDEWTIHVRIPNLALHPALDELRQAIIQAVQKEMPSAQQIQVKWERTASPPWLPQQSNVHYRLDEPLTTNDNISPGLASTTHIVAVYSCKGGVGKSTIALNLAYSMAQQGLQVGLLDVDVFGPSLPTLVSLEPEEAAVRPSPLGPAMVYPIEHKGVRLLSLGFVSSKSGVPNSGGGDTTGAAIMRGPMASRVATQLLKGTDWGDLDVLVLDLPPGTGDVQLSICQELHHVSGAVGVTTPSQLALVDAKKGIQMFESLNIPTLAVVENMSYFECDLGTRYYPFGKGTDKGDAASLAKALGIASSSCGVFQLPISPHTTNANETGVPLCLARPPEAVVDLGVLDALAKNVSAQLFQMQHGVSISTEPTSGITLPNNPTTVFDLASAVLSVNDKTQSFRLRFFSKTGAATQVEISGAQLRLTHPKTGQPMEQQRDDIAKTVAPSASSGGGCGVHVHQHTASPSPKLPRLFPVTLERKGSFGYSVEWADGATIIYSMESLAKAAGGKVV